MAPLWLILFIQMMAGKVLMGGIIEEWNAAFIEAVKKETPPPCLTSRNLPIFHLAIYRSVEAAATKGGSAEQQDQAAHAAALQAFHVFFPSQTGVEWKSSSDAVLPPSMQGTVRDEVQRTFKEREADEASTTVHYIPSNKPGQWKRTPPHFRPPELPHWGQMKPFVLDDVAQYRAPSPPALDSATYAEEVEEVLTWGAKEGSKRTAEETMIARFWSDFSYTTSPAGHWNDIAREISLQRKLSTRESARLFTVLNMATADACIAIWNTKYHFNYWRPVTAIHRADEDGNEATKAVLDWEPLLVTPPHPDYVSGHSGISGAAAQVMENLFGTDNLSFEVMSDTVQDTKRRFTSFTDCAEEISRSRVLGGIHFPSACREGLLLGRRVADQVLNDFDKIYKPQRQ